MAASKRDRLERLRGQLDAERSSFISHWRDLGDYILPMRPRFTLSDRNRGNRKNTKIIDSTATLAARTLRSGLMSGLTSPARPWFKLTTHDPDKAENNEVKQWLHIVTTRMLAAFSRSNLYNALPVAYGDLGAFASTALFIEEDFDTVLHCTPQPLGSFYIAQNHKGLVNVFFREFGMTVRQIVETFGELKSTGQVDFKNVSRRVKDQWEQGFYETWIDVCHVIQPNPDYNPGGLSAKHKKFESVYYEKGSGSFASNLHSHDDDKFLRHSGYDLFPVLAPRWQVTGEDVYGSSCPGMEALGDIKQLQQQEKRIAQAIDKMVNPPMTGPSALKQQRVSILPGDITYSDEREGQKGFRPVHEVNPRINEIEAKQQQIRSRISRAFFEDLFLMLANTDRRQITAREVEERHEEKLLALGPVLEQLDQDLLNPLIDLTFDIMLRQELLPQPPEEIQGEKLKVEYISVMSQAQKLVGLGSIERFTGFASQVAQADPAVLDKVDRDQLIDVYGDMTSIPPGIVRTDDDVDAIRQQRAEAQQAQQKMAAIQQSAQTAKDLSQTDMEGNNALTQLVGGAQGQ